MALSIYANTGRVFCDLPVPYPSRVTASLALSVAATCFFQRIQFTIYYRPVKPDTKVYWDRQSLLLSKNTGSQ